MCEPKAEPAEAKTPPQPLRCRCSGGLACWLRRTRGSLIISTYTSSKLVAASFSGDRFRCATHRLPRPLGVALQGQRLAVAVREQILAFRLKRAADPRSAVYELERSWDTGKVNAHDLAFGRRGLYFANTRYNSLSRSSERKQFMHYWLPPFITEMVAQDRCHLNGLGMLAGRPQLMTAFCETDERNDWRKEDRFSSGVLIDVPQNRIVARGLCMPHSPRYYRGQWWFCDSGRGSLSRFDPSTGDCREICSLPGFTRGLCFVGNYALVGLSKIRPQHILDAPPVRERHPQLLAGVALVNLTTGASEGCLEFTSGGREVFEVAFLRGVTELRWPE